MNELFHALIIKELERQLKITERQVIKLESWITVIEELPNKDNISQHKILEMQGQILYKKCKINRIKEDIKRNKEML